MATPFPLSHMFDIVEGFPVVDLQTSANNGDYINMKNVEWLVILFGSGVGTAGDDPTVTVQQATTNAGGSAKALNIVTSPLQVFKKQAATSLAAVTTWSDASGDVTTNTITDSDSAEQDLIYAIMFQGSDLDVANGFDHVRATIADIGSNAQPGFLLYLVTPMYGSKPTETPSYL